MPFGAFGVKVLFISVREGKSLGAQMEGPLVTELRIGKEALLVAFFLGITEEGSGISQHWTLVNWAFGEFHIQRFTHCCHV